METTTVDSVDALVESLSVLYIQQQKSIEKLEYCVAENRKVIRHLEARLTTLRAQEVGSAAAAPSKPAGPPPAAKDISSQARAERLVSQLKGLQVTDAARPSSSARASSARATSEASASTSLPATGPSPPKVPRMLTLPPEFRQKSRAFQSDITQGILAARDRMMDSAAEFLVQCDQAIERAPPGLEHLSLAGWYSTPALQRLDTLALIEATRRVIAEAESGSRVRPEIQRLWEQIQDAADQIPSKDPLEAGRSWAQRVLRAVGPPPRDDPAAALAAQDRLEASAREDPALWNVSRVSDRGLSLLPPPGTKALAYRTDAEIATMAKVQQQIQWTALQSDIEAEFVAPLAEAALEALQRPGITREDVATAATLLRAVTAMSGRGGVAAVAEEVQVYMDYKGEEGAAEEEAPSPTPSHGARRKN